MEMITTHILLYLLIIIIGSLWGSKKTGIADVLFYLIGGLIAVNFHLLSPHSATIETFAFIGTIFLFFYLGLEENLEGFAQGVKKGWKIALAGVILPFLMIYLIEYFFSGDTIKAIVFAMAFAPTSIGIAFLTLNTLSFSAKAKLQPIIVAAALTDDVLSLILWGVLGGVLVSLQASSSLGISLEAIAVLALSPLSNFLFFSGVMVLIAYLFFLFNPTTSLKKSGTFLNLITKTKNSIYSHLGATQFLGKQETNAAIIIMIFLAFLGSFIAEYFATSVALGAYFMGLIINKDHFENQNDGDKVFHEAIEKFRFLTLYFFAPIFFISIGLQMEIGSFSLLLSVLFNACILAFVLFAAQFVAAALTAYYINKLPWHSASLIGIAMQGRAEVTFLVAMAALSMKLITSADLLLISLTAFILNLSVPFLLKIAGEYHEKKDQSSLL
ncbi:MAG: cation:proton antiporter [Sulfurimonas sp.]|uniref:cation:proton antiporter n=1 Tax=Sulfurimonas sp. TaxID=2022749 RepID=UPI002615C1C7|nr:cation:proton antiporter [Sulfurimonas sp.]MDD5373745.1 cation:proton antiporter [Sulfurimonas sp.]